VKAAVEIPLETVCAAIAEWLVYLKTWVGKRASILSDIVINKYLKRLLIKYLARKVDVLYNFPYKSKYTRDRTNDIHVYLHKLLG
jgi:hypothetical protein